MFSSPEKRHSGSFGRVAAAKMLRCFPIFVKFHNLINNILMREYDFTGYEKQNAQAYYHNYINVDNSSLFIPASSLKVHPELA